MTITGSNFIRATEVKFDRVKALFTGESDKTITTKVPLNASTGPITVVNQGGDAGSSNNFEVETVASLPNLASVNTLMEPTEFPIAGTAFIVYFSFVNTGGSESGDFTIRLQLDNSTKIKDIDVASMQPGMGNQVSWTFSSGLSAGNHSIYAYLDISNRVAEISESDNIGYHGFQVLEVPRCANGQAANPPDNNHPTWWCTDGSTTR